MTTRQTNYKISETILEQIEEEAFEPHHVIQIEFLSMPVFQRFTLMKLHSFTDDPNMRDNLLYAVAITIRAFKLSDTPKRETTDTQLFNEFWDKFVTDAGHLKQTHLWSKFEPHVWPYAIALLGSEKTGMQERLAIYGINLLVLMNLYYTTDQWQHVKAYVASESLV